MNTKSNDIRSFDGFILTIALIPLFWILGIKFFIFHLASLVLFVNVIINKKRNNLKVKYNKLHYILLFFILSYSLSIILNFNMEDIKRIIASVYNLSYWIMGLLIMISFYNIDIKIKDINFISNSIKLVLLFQILLLIVGVCLWIFGIKNLQISSLIGAFLNSNIDLLQDSISTKFYISQWDSGKEVLRFIGVSIYPTACALIVGVMMVYSCINIKSNKFRVFIICASYILVLATRSRTVIVALPLSIIIILAIFYFNDIKQLIIKNKKIALAIFMLFVIGLFTIVFRYGIIDKFIFGREGSNNARMQIYKETINIFLQNKFIGSGYKIYLPNLDVPIGSHSTYLSVLMKTGLIGFTMFVLFIVMLGKVWIDEIKVFKNEKNTELKLLHICTGITMLLYSIWFITEDIDAPQIACLLFFINASIINGLDKLRLECKKNDYSKINICFVGSSGGHLTHLMQLKPWWKDKKRFWVTFNKADAISQLTDEKTYWCYYPTNRNIKNLFRNTLLAIRILAIEKPDLVVSSGAAPAIPYYYLGKFIGCKLVYIEVYDRIDSPTVTGKLVYPLCDKFIVQWDEQLNYYKNAENFGGLF
ncbi:PssD/Cps14F family polysaccharide biosynthesis glycosyltransferase [Clostridium sp.]|uniref:PssD/Cps14F family polysaccharide biosynthesis glycosyltransferase n=1 Tax=Clostridium sp. TaxID=1506 RepID=UPI0037BFC093